MYFGAVQRVRLDVGGDEGKGVKGWVSFPSFFVVVAGKKWGSIERIEETYPMKKKKQVHDLFTRKPQNMYVCTCT